MVSRLRFWRWIVLWLAPLSYLTHSLNSHILATGHSLLTLPLLQRQTNEVRQVIITTNSYELLYCVFVVCPFLCANKIARIFFSLLLFVDDSRRMVKCSLVVSSIGWWAHSVCEVECMQAPVWTRTSEDQDRRRRRQPNFQVCVCVCTSWCVWRPPRLHWLAIGHPGFKSRSSWFVGTIIVIFFGKFILFRLVSWSV